MGDVMDRQKTAAEFRLEAVLHSIDRICDSWQDAIQAAAAVPWPSGGGEGGSSASGHGDRTANTASRLADKGNVAMSWLSRSRRTLAIMLSAADASGAARRAGEGRWTGPFNPPAMRVTLGSAARELSEWKPMGLHKLFNSIVSLGNEGAHNWPPTPKVGEKIGDIVVGKRGRTGEDCAKCGKYVAGDAADPIRRLDGKPYHAHPCWETVRSRKRRAS